MKKLIMLALLAGGVYLHCRPEGYTPGSARKAVAQGLEKFDKGDIAGIFSPGDDANNEKKEVKGKPVAAKKKPHRR